MRVPIWVKDFVCFLCVEKQEGGYKYGGTAFFVSIPSELNPEDLNFRTDYLVTAKHCVEKAKNHGKLFVRVNTLNGPAKVVEITSEWLYCEDEAVDIAVTRFIPTEPIQHYPIALISLADDSLLRDYRVEIGNDILIAGLFTQHYGTQRNIPIVRSGIIAAMPDEPFIERESGLSYRAYLAEVRSIGGLSGSPVFAVIDNSPNDARILPGGASLSHSLFVLGLVRGHWDLKREQTAIDFSGDELEQVNMGIAIVTPSQELISLLNRKDIVKDRRKEESEKRKKWAPTSGGKSNGK